MVQHNIHTQEKGRSWGAPEILSPAGDWERLEAAVRFGADAVYLGAEQFGMRASAASFGREKLREGVAYCHRQGVKVYLTCNTLPRNREIDQLPDFFQMARECGVDALIAADIGVLLAAKRALPEMDIHVSTQAGVVNYLTARELYDMGAKRVVLARELSLEEIREIREKTPPQLEIEAFVHGAMCVSFSGRCLLSSYLVNRDPNRGECAQPCRWGYHLTEEKRPELHFPIFEDEKGSYILNAKDLCMISHIHELAQAGITSFKIEGRAKSAYYVAVITNAYRQAVDRWKEAPDRFQLEPWMEEETRKVSHRQYCTGFYFGPPNQGQYYGDSGYIRSYDVVAVVEGYAEGRLLCVEKNRFSVGDRLELVIPGRRPEEMTVSAMEDGEGQSISCARHPMMQLRIPCERPYPAGTILRKQQEQERVAG